MTTDALYLVGGVVLLLAVALPSALERRAVSAPIVLVVLGALLGLLPLPAWVDLDPLRGEAIVERVTELTVLIALMGVGLALDRPLDLRSRTSIRGWSPTWRLLAVAMPLTIAAVTGLTWATGFALPAALLLGASLAPTDPVLAGDVQVEGPSVAAGEDDAMQEDDEVRFTLTSEGGSNDGLAFPFVYAAIFLSTRGPVSGWGWSWLAWDLAGKIVVGVGVGWLSGYVLSKVAFRSHVRSLRMAEQGEPLFALAGLLTAYGAGEVAGGYGFLSVFACAMTIRDAERTHEYHRHMHELVERMERLLTLLVLLVLGVALTRGILAHLDWRGVLVAVTLILVIRPAAAWLSLSFHPLEPDEPGGLRRSERAVVAFFGVRGVGTLYYLAYGLGAAKISDMDARWLWSTATFTIVLSVLVHGVLSTPVLTRLDRHRGLAD